MPKTISVKETGAKGDGITDDTEAFRLALMQEGEVHVPDGLYVITDALPVSRLCRGISSDSGGGIILARHPEWGYDFPRYFSSAIIAPTTVIYQVKCAAVRGAIKLFAEFGRIPGWLSNMREQVLPVTPFFISRLTVVGAEPDTAFGGLRWAAWDQHISFDVTHNAFMTEEWWNKRKDREGREALDPRKVLARMIYDAFDAKFTDEYIGPLDPEDFTATLDGSFSFLTVAEIVQGAQAAETTRPIDLENLKHERE